mgnify:CR=1 FL=1
MAKKKTFNVEDLIQMVNSSLKYSDSEYAERRTGTMVILEEILHRTGNYKGFRYLLADECKGLPGVNYAVDAKGTMQPHPDIEKRFENTDRTRVMYY